MAIILKEGRPSIRTEKGTFAAPAGWEKLERSRENIEAAIDAVGLLRLEGDPLMDWVGTAFLVAPGCVLTAAFSARTFIEGTGDLNLTNKPGKSASVSFRSDDVAAPGLSIKIASALFIHPHYLVALLQLEPADDPSELTLPRPLTLAAAPPEPLAGREVVTIGFPTRDMRGDPALMEEVFGKSFNQKTLQPGALQGAIPLGPDSQFGTQALGATLVTHDCSTLGGFGGSPLVDLETGHVLGLHFAGFHLKENLAVPSWELARDSRVRLHGVAFSDDPPWLSLWQEAAWRAKSSRPSPPEPPVPLSNPRFSAEQLYKIRELLMRTGFTETEKQRSLFVSMNMEFTSSLPSEGTPDIRLLIILDVLNRTPRLIDQELPMETFLINAVHGAKPRPESVELQQYLDKVRGVAD